MDYPWLKYTRDVILMLKQYESANLLLICTGQVGHNIRA